MLSNDEIIKKFESCRSRFVEGWKRTEWLEATRECYSAVEGFSYEGGKNGQWENLDFQKREFDNKPLFQINKLARVINVISGFQIQNRGDVRYIPRDIDIAQDGQFSDKSKLADVVNDGLEFIKQASRADLENSHANYDALICGIGAVDNTITYEEGEDGIGEPSVQRIAPQLLMWDVAARKKNLIDANWVCSATVHDREVLLNEINAERATEDKIVAFSGSSGDDLFLNSYTDMDKNLIMAYNFQWREKEFYWQVQNTALQNPAAMQLLLLDGSVQAAKERGIDLTKDEIFPISLDEERAFKQAFELVGLPFEAIKQKKYVYYRASIVGKDVISASENYSQKGFSLKFITGKWSETRQYWYGLLSLAIAPQQLFNKGMSDIAETLYISPHGGIVIEAEAVGGAGNLAAFKETWAKQREVTIIADGAIAGQKFMMKPQAQLSPAAMQVLDIADRAILECVGLNQEFMGVADGGAQQAAMLQEQRVKQGMASFANEVDSFGFFIQEQSKCFVDMLRVLCQNSGGLIIRNISGDKAQPYVKLLEDQIATKYDIIVKEVPKSSSERQRETDVLLQIAGMLTQAGRDGGAILPLIIENQDINSDKLEEVLAATQPPPPAQPDPVNQELLMAQAADLRASAAKKEAESKGLDMELLNKFKQMRDEDNNELEIKMEKMKADIQKTISETMVNYSKIGQSIQQPQSFMGNNA